MCKPQIVLNEQTINKILKKLLTLTLSFDTLIYAFACWVHKIK